MTKNPTQQKQIDAAAARWTDLVLAHVRSKRLNSNRFKKVVKKIGGDGNGQSK